MTSLSNEIATCCKTLCAQEAWVFGKKHALKAVEGLFRETTRDSKDAVSVDVLLPLAAPMAEHLLPSGHTDTIKTTCALLVVFVKTLGVAFCPFADQVVVPLLNVGRKMRRRTTEERLANPSLPQSKLVDQMLWESAETCLDVMSSKSRSEHKDELLQLPPPEMRYIFVQCYGGHGISTANGPASADMAKDAMVEEEMVEDD
ncbi:unnamed protein product, partial [Aphanomyces euteiches]